MPPTQAIPATNRLLDSLPDKDRQHFLSSCEQVELVFEDVLNEPNDIIHHVYFPTDSFISMIKPIDDGPGLEVGLIGNEGMHGIPVVLGVEISTHHSVVQGAGPALRITAASFLRELEQSPALLSLIQRYIYVSMMQLAQTAACNRFHLVEQRLARWLLMTKDRAHTNEFQITHEFLAKMLGVRRVGVTKAAGIMQKKKLISYSRGAMKIHRLAGLEAVSCSCYRTDKETYDHIMHC